MADQGETGDRGAAVGSDAVSEGNESQSEDVATSHTKVHHQGMEEHV